MSRWEQMADQSLRCHVANEAEMITKGYQIAGILNAGDVVALIGDLGAGKTRFVKAVAEASGVPSDEVNSPTFTLIQEYQGRILIRHCDTYRLRNADEFADLGLDELFAPDCIALIEWADRVEDYLPRDRLVVRIKIDTPTKRTLELTATGERSSQILEKLMKFNV